MKHLIGKTIETSITEDGLVFTIVVDSEFTVEIVQPEADLFELLIVPTNEPNVVIVDSVEFSTLFEAIKNADEIVEELLAEPR